MAQKYKNKMTFDPNFPGFGIRETGKKKTYFIYAWSGKRKVYKTIGSVQDIKLNDARREALDFISRIKSEAKESSLKHICEYWINRVGITQKSIKTSRKRINKVLTILKNKTLSEVRTKDFQDIHHQLSAIAPIEANRTLKLFRAIFNKAIVWELIDRNPARGVSLNREKKRKRTISIDEVCKIMEAIETRKSLHAKGALKLMFLTGLRTNEVLKLKWSNFIDNKLIIEDTKNNNDYSINLSKLAVTIINSIPKTVDSTYIFPQPCGTKHMRNLNSTWRRIKKQAKIKDVWLHDIRRTAATWLGEEGFSWPQIGSQLNQKTIQTTKDYSVLVPSEEIANALEKKFLQNITKK